MEGFDVRLGLCARIGALNLVAATVMRRAFAVLLTSLFVGGCSSAVTINPSAQATSVIIGAYQSNLRQPWSRTETTVTFLEGQNAVGQLDGAGSASFRTFDASAVLQAHVGAAQFAISEFRHIGHILFQSTGNNWLAYDYSQKSPTKKPAPDSGNSAPPGADPSQMPILLSALQWRDDIKMTKPVFNENGQGARAESFKVTIDASKFLRHLNNLGIFIADSWTTWLASGTFDLSIQVGSGRITNSIATIPLTPNKFESVDHMTIQFKILTGSSKPVARPPAELVSSPPPPA